MIKRKIMAFIVYPTLTLVRQNVKVTYGLKRNTRASRFYRTESAVLFCLFFFVLNFWLQYNATFQDFPASSTRASFHLDKFYLLVWAEKYAKSPC